MSWFNPRTIATDLCWALNHSFMLDGDEETGDGLGAFELLNWMRDLTFDEAEAASESDDDVDQKRFNSQENTLFFI